MSQVLEPKPIEEQHGFFKQYVKIAGRKARCALCHGKILVDAPYSINNGLICHDACIEETKNLDNNVRRRTLKLMGIGAAFAGATAIGASRLASASGVQQTQITANGVILPSLTSDPANPEPGQMWYRSDAGVTAYFDAIENRVIYSNRIVNGSAVVSPKGIANGLSVLPNDGQDWGPDTMLGATAPGQYGPPYTQTSTIKEIITYMSPNGGKVLFKNGTYTIQEPIFMWTNGSWTFEGEGIQVNSGSYTNSTGVVIQVSSSFPTTSDILSSIGITMPYMWYIYGIDGNALTVSMDKFLFVGNSNCGAITTQTVSPYAPIGVFDFGWVSFDYFGSGSVVFLQPDGGPCTIKALQLDDSSGSVFLNGDIDIDHLEFYFNTGPYCLDVGGVERIGSIYYATNSNNTGLLTSQTQYSLVPIGYISATAFGGAGAATGSYIFNGLTSPVSVILIEMNNTDNMGLIGSSDQYGALYCKTLIYNNNVAFSGTFLNNINANTPIIIDDVYFQTSNTVSLSPQNSLSIVKHIYPTPTPTIATSPPVSGTVYKNTNPFDIEIDLPVYATTAGTAGYVTLAKGPSSTPVAIGNQYVNGATSSTSTDIIKLRVPAGWYYSFTASGVTFGTASVFAD